MVYITLWNIFVFLLYGIDKLKSIKGSFRISEKALIFCTLFLGGAGATLGMIIFHHKTRKIKFHTAAAIGIMAIVIAVKIKL